MNLQEPCGKLWFHSLFFGFHGKIFLTHAYGNAFMWNHGDFSSFFRGWNSSIILCAETQLHKHDFKIVKLNWKSTINRCLSEYDNFKNTLREISTNCNYVKYAIKVANGYLNIWGFEGSNSKLRLWNLLLDRGNTVPCLHLERTVMS